MKGQGYYVAATIPHHHPRALGLGALRFTSVTIIITKFIQIQDFLYPRHHLNVKYKKFQLLNKECMWLDSEKVVCCLIFVNDDFAL